MESQSSSIASEPYFEGGDDNAEPGVNLESDEFGSDQMDSAVKNTISPRSRSGKSFYKKKSSKAISMKIQTVEKPQHVEELVDKYRSLNFNEEGAKIELPIESKILLHPKMNILVFVSKSLLVILDMCGNNLSSVN